LPAAGIALLASADNTGVADATAIFASARSAHPNPNVPKGTFSVTALPFNGDGFWGAGQLSVNGVLVSLPRGPERGSRFLRARQTLAAQIFSGGCLIVNSDSIGNGEAASTSQKTWVSLLARFLNMGIAIDEPVIANFDADASGTPAFHGVTFSNPSTITNNTAGPTGKGVDLQPGQVITIVGAFENIEVTYQGVASGQLTFAAGGSSYSVQSTASSGNDVVTTAGATGQTGFVTYTITNTGSVVVPITAIIRKGVKVAGSPPRLNVCRFAHGSYQMTNYGAAQIASMKRIADAVGGGTNHFLLAALGTNDRNNSYATLLARVATFAGNWISAGVPARNILPVMPWRAPAGSYTAPFTFEEATAGLRDGWRTAGVAKFVQTDGVDFVAQGLTASTTDVHPNDAGMALVFNLVVKALCGFGA
jgi:hypothetical protein